VHRRAPPDPCVTEPAKSEPRRARAAKAAERRKKHPTASNASQRGALGPNRRDAPTCPTAHAKTLGNRLSRPSHSVNFSADSKDLEEDRSDVGRTGAAVRDIDELVDGILCAERGDDSHLFQVGEVAMEAVRAEQVAIAGLNGVHHRVYLHVFAVTD